MTTPVLREDAFELALLHHFLTKPDDLVDLWPVPHELEHAAAA